MPRKKFAQVQYGLIQKELPLEQLGMAVQLLWHCTEWYFMGLDHDPNQPHSPEKLERIPLNSRAIFAVTRRKKRDAAKNGLINLGKRLGFSVEYDGDTAWIIWPNWWITQGLRPSLKYRKTADGKPKSGGTERNRNVNKNGTERDPPDRPSSAKGEEIPEPYRFGQRDRVQIEKLVLTQYPSLLEGAEDLSCLQWEWIRDCQSKGFTRAPDNPAAAFTGWIHDRAAERGL